MAVEPGTTIRHYEIRSLLGSGAMGQVYRARDGQLGRDVAVKVIPPSFAGDRDRLQRFAREARVLASLNHPNIAAIYGVEECGGVTALILELVPGPTLAELLAKGPLPIRQALDVAKQIAYALESAHEKGIIHRDIKPANIKVTDEGVVKVLDFGLAKDRAANLSSTPAAATTGLDPATEAGIILGTTAYMSPEQASGGPVDRRTDIWAFGCVLYEMLTGRRAFSGDSFSVLLSAVLTGHADLTHLPAHTPRQVRELLKRCLDRDPKQRLRDIGEARVALERPAESEVTPRGRIERRAAIAWLAAGIAAGMLLGIVPATLWMRKGDAEAPQPARLVMPLAPSEILDPRAYKRPILRAFAISRDGSFVVFAGTRNNRSMIFRRRLSDGSATPIAGTEDGHAPILSPDSRWVAFESAGVLRKVPVEGGAPFTLCAAPQLTGASWAQDGTITFGTFAGPLLRVSATGGTPQAVTGLDRRTHETSHRLPQWLPEDRGVMFTATSGVLDLGRIFVLPAGSRESRALVDDAADARYADGRLFYARRGILYTVPFDLDRLATTGSESPLLEGVMQSTGDDNPALNTGAAQYDVSETGTMVFVEGGVFPPHMNRLLWLDRRGNTKSISEPAPNLLGARLSPDARKVAVALVNHPDEPIRIYDLDRGGFSGLPDVRGEAVFPVWSPDREHLAFTWTKNGVGQIHIATLDGSAPPRPLAGSSDTEIPAEYSPDGKMLAYVRLDQRTKMDIWVAPTTTGGTPRQIVATTGDDRQPAFSPDGRWLAYTSDSSGRQEVFVTAFPGPGPRIQTSTTGGVAPAWSTDGHHLTYVGQQMLMQVPVQTSPSIRIGRPSAVVPFNYLVPYPSRSHDLTRDGERLLVTTWESRPDQPVTGLQLILNWRGVLERR